MINNEAKSIVGKHHSVLQCKQCFYFFLLVSLFVYVTAECAAMLAPVVEQEQAIGVEAQQGAAEACEREEQTTKLLDAALYGNSPVVRSIVDLYPDLIDVEDRFGRTPLTLSMAHKDLEVIEFLLQKKANLEQRNQNHQTPLTIAIQYSDVQSSPMVELLLRYKADAYVEPLHSPMGVAIEHNKTAAIQLLLDNNADIECQVWGSTPLLYAINLNRTDAVAFLLEKGARLDAVDAEGNGVGYYLNVLRKPSAGRSSIENFYPNVSTLDMRTIIFAAEREIRRLEQEKAEQHERELEEQSKPLYQAIVAGNLGVVESILLENPALVNVEIEQGSTPLLQAIEMGRIEVIELLLQKKANIEQKNQWRQTPLACAICRLDYSSPYSFPSQPIVELLLRYKADANAQLPGVPLMCAIERNKVWAVQLLLDNNADIEYRSLGYNPFADSEYQSIKGITPLLSAIIHGRGNIASLLLEKGANINVVDDEGRGVDYYINIKKPTVREVIEAAQRKKRQPELERIQQQERERFEREIIERTILQEQIKLEQERAEAEQEWEKCKQELRESYEQKLKGYQEQFEQKLKQHIEQERLKNEREQERMCWIKAIVNNEPGTIQLLLDTKIVDGGNGEWRVGVNGNNDIYESCVDFVLCDKYKTTPLQLAADMGRVDIVNLLLGYRADVNRVDSRGRDAAFFIRHKRAEVEAVEQMIGTAQECAEYEMQVLLTQEAEEWAEQQAQERALEEARAQLGRQAQNVRLFAAAKQGDISTATRLLEHGAQVNAVNDFGDTALYYAARESHLEMVKLLLQHKASVDVMDDVESNDDHGIVDILCGIIPGIREIVAVSQQKVHVEVQKQAEQIQKLQEQLIREREQYKAHVVELRQEQESVTSQVVTSQEQVDQEREVHVYEQEGQSALESEGELEEFIITDGDDTDDSQVSGEAIDANFTQVFMSLSLR